MHRGRRVLMMLAVSAASVGLLTAVALSQEPEQAPMGADPAAFSGPGGELKYDAAPDWFPVYGNGGQVIGYVRKEDLFVTPASAPARIASPVGDLSPGPRIPIFERPDEASRVVGMVREDVDG